MPEEKKEKGTGDTSEELIAENFPKLMTATKSQIQESQRTVSWVNAPKFYT